MEADTHAQLAQRFDRMTEARAEHQRLTRRRAHLAPQLREAAEEVRRLGDAFDKEAADVHRLEGGASPTRVWAAVRGGLREQIERERAEAETVRFQLARAEEVLGRLREEDSRLEAARARVDEEQVGYEDTLAEVQRRAQDPDAAILRERAADAGRQLEDLRWRRELDEALTAGDEARAALLTAQERLGSAKAWSAYDTFAGGGMLVSMLKHDRLDRATEVLDRAAAALQLFSRELADVELPGLDAPVVDELSRGLDIWFDNFLTDLMVGQRISAASNQVAAAVAAVEDVLRTLRELRARLDG